MPFRLAELEMKNVSDVIRFRGREEKILESFSIRGRRYFALEKLSHRGAFRVFDPHTGPGGDYRVLHQIPYSRMTQQRIETLRRLGGPTANRNFPFIVESGRHGPDLFVIMTWLWGTNLRDLLRQVRDGSAPRPGVPETVRLFRGLAHGLSHFHRRANVIHGDVSPANILITSGTKNLVLIDFGSAWPIENSARKVAGDGLTPPYAAPERITGHALQDFRTDAFSLAVVAYEMLTLEIPFDGAGGKAGTPNLIDSYSKSFVPPSKLISKPDRLPPRSIKQLDDLFRVGLSQHPDSRPNTRKEWLGAWDELHFALQKGGRLSRLERNIVDCFQLIAKLFHHKL